MTSDFGFTVPSFPKTSSVVQHETLVIIFDECVKCSSAKQPVVSALFDLLTSYASSGLS